MPLSWNEIRDRALQFSKVWEDAFSEKADAQTFWNEFFKVFGISRKRVASFERPVKFNDDEGGTIDLLWKGLLLVEHKSKGKNLDRAYHQATDYFYGLKERDLPRYVIVSDFARLRLYDLEKGKQREIELRSLHKEVQSFGFIAGYAVPEVDEDEEAANIRAALQLGKLHDLLKGTGYGGHDLEVFLVRILFCLFAEDSGIFDKSQFRDYLDLRTSEDGSDLGIHLGKLFEVLDTPPGQRSVKLDEQLASFAYIDGRLFSSTIHTADFDRPMREALLDACNLDWSQISPAIFGSLFQSVMDKGKRRDLGGHYTHESNILKAIRPLFLDDLERQLESIGNDKKRLLTFQRTLAAIKILDPACGCGNFLVIAYRELRKLELEVLRRMYMAGLSSKTLDIAGLVHVDVDQLYGIEIEDFPSQISQVALWLTDHQMNLVVSAEFGHYFARLPLQKSPNIVHGDALEVDWAQVVDPAQLSYIVGNPPYLGKKEQSKEQKAQVMRLYHGIKGAGVLDYVACWYKKSVDFMAANPAIQCAFVSTNSVTQGEQVSIMWPPLVHTGLVINFAHRTFEWMSDAPKKAAVHCVIVGFALFEKPKKWLFDYPTFKSKPTAAHVSKINCYLIEGEQVWVHKRSTPICPGAPPMSYGSMPIDDGHLSLTAPEARELINIEPRATPYVRRYTGSDEFINGIERYCLWLINCPPQLLRQMKPVMSRVEATRQFRLESDRTATKVLAGTPYLFGEIRQPEGDYLIVPKVSSLNRPYIPIRFFGPEMIASGSALVVPSANLYHFGILQSAMHLAWVLAVGGRTKSDPQYSVGLIYNNFPWPDPSPNQEAAVMKVAQDVLDARTLHPASTLADLYDLAAMPVDLVKAHAALDRAVDSAYGAKGLTSAATRAAFLFEKYQAIASPISTTVTKAKTSRKLH